jgi:hypothetical protein
MQTSQHAGDRSSPASSSPKAARFRQDSEGVILQATGWHGPIGRCLNIDLSARVTVLQGPAPGQSRSIPWLRVDVPVFFPSHIATLLSLQGAPIQNLFPPEAYFAAGGYVFLGGPFALIRGRVSSFADAPFRVQDLVLAGLPPEHFQPDVLRTLAADVLAGG